MRQVGVVLNPDSCINGSYIYDVTWFIKYSKVYSERLEIRNQLKGTKCFICVLGMLHIRNALYFSNK